MDFISQYIHFILHLNTHILQLIHTLGPWIYGVMFLIIFLECGVFATPFLPGESMLFALGTIAGTGVLNVHLMVVLLVTAAISGGFLNYAIGYFIGKKICKPEKDTFFQGYIARTQEFYKKHGAMTIIIARLLPIIRTYAPFIAGVARMKFRTFSLYNIIGGVVWICGFLYLSFLFGHIPIVKQNFSIVIIGIIIISVLPIGVQILRYILSSNSNKVKQA